MALTTINSDGVKDDSIVNADIKSDAAIALSKLASTPAVLTGSTNNTITTVTGANAIQGEANLTFDGTLLTVNGGSSDTPLIINATNAGGPHLRFQQDGSTKHFVGCGTGIGGLGDKDDLTIRAYDNIFLATNNTSTARLTIDAAGEVGIGTTPTTILDVRDTSTTSYPFTSSDSGTYSYTPYAHELNLRNNTAGTDDGFAGIHFHAGERSEGGRQGTARISALYTGEYKADLVFATRNVSFKERLRIKSGGQLCIGTTNGPGEPGIYLGDGTNPAGHIYANGQDHLYILANAYYNGGWKYQGTGHGASLTIGDGDLVFNTAPTGTAGNAITWAEVFRAKNSNGDLSLTNGNLVLATAGKGIDFSASSNQAGVFTGGETLTDYEAGLYTPDLLAHGGSWVTASLDSGNKYGSYVKIGNMVHVQAYFTNFHLDSAHDGDLVGISLPITPDSGNTGYSALTTVHANCFVSGKQTNFFVATGHSRAYGIQEASTSYDTWRGEATRYLMVAGTYRAG